MHRGSGYTGDYACEGVSKYFIRLKIYLESEETKMNGEFDYRNNFLSNSNHCVHFEKNIVITDLGRLFNEKVRAYTGTDVFVSSMSVNKSRITVELKVLGQSGGRFGEIASYSEDDISDIKNGFCRNVWSAYTESEKELDYPPLVRHAKYQDDGRSVPYKLYIEIIDFKKRSRIGFFVDYMPEIQRKLREKFPKASFIVRLKDDDTNFYYLIFDDEKELKFAQEVYGIDSMVEFVGGLCREEDEYGVFCDYLPVPAVTDKVTLKKQGEVMGIMRNNPDFSEW